MPYLLYIICRKNMFVQYVNKSPFIASDSAVCLDKNS